MSASVSAAVAPREVVLGAHSKVWRALSRSSQIAERFRIAIGHSELRQFAFSSNDRVWVFAYSRKQQENTALLQALQQAGVREVVYVSSAATIVTRFTRCYRYPTVKRLAENEARDRLNARILVLGIVYESSSELPYGVSAGTALTSIAEFLLAPRWPFEDGAVARLFAMVEKPFVRGWEARLHRWYSATQWALRRWPCVLRPLDLILRIVGIRWYGYVNLSNRLWSSTK